MYFWRGLFISFLNLKQIKLFKRNCPEVSQNCYIVISIKEITEILELLVNQIF